jgi:hypothetical protein
MLRFILKGLANQELCRSDIKESIEKSLQNKKPEWKYYF